MASLGIISACNRTPCVVQVEDVLSLLRNEGRPFLALLTLSLAQCGFALLSS